MRLVFTINWLVCLLILVPVYGQTHKPQFKDYPIVERYTGPYAAPKISRNTDAWIYRTQIRRIAQGKPNFAGHYSVGTWGCGSSCCHFAIVDKQTGNIYYKQSQACSWDMTDRDIPKNIAFRLNSSLLILDCSLGEELGATPHYYKFERNRLIALR